MWKIEATLPEILQSSDWKEVFGEGYGGNTDKRTDSCPPGAEIDLTPPTLAMIREVLGTVTGDRDGPEWVGVFLLNDGRYLLATGWCDYTGWDCRAWNYLEVANTVEDLIQFGLSSEQKSRLQIEGE